MWVFNFRDPNLTFRKSIPHLLGDVEEDDITHNQYEQGSSINQPPLGWRTQTYTINRQAPGLAIMDPPIILPDTPSPSR
jgi:hypothetical protein